jgi:hypothetical protein
MSNLVFRSSDRYYSVWTCRCGCDGFVKVTGVMEHEVGNSAYFYIRGHQAVGTTYEHIGTRYEFVAEALRSIGSPVETFEQLPATLPLSQTENASQRPLDALGDAQDDWTCKTLPWNEWPNDDDA